MRSHARASSAGSTRRQGAPTYRLSGFVSGLLTALVVIALVAASATAAIDTRLKAASFGSDGTSGTSFANNPRQLSFDQAAKSLYVFNAFPEADRKIYGFDASTPGTFTPLGGNFPVAVAAGGESDIATDNTAIPSATAGNLYYESAGSQSVFGFDSAGASLGAPFPIEPGSPKYLTGVGVDPSGYIWVGDWEAQKVRKYDPATGTEIGSVNTATIGSGRPAHPAFDSNGDMYLCMYFGSTYKLTAAGGYDPSQATLVDSGSALDVAVDATSHRVYVVHFNKVSAYDSTGAFLYDFADGISGESLMGAAVNEATDTVYVSDDGNDKVYAYGPAQSFADATATPNPPTSITPTTATISATITDNSVLPTVWRLELSSNAGTSWSTVLSGKTAGNQSGLVVSKELSSLVPNSNYQFRIVANKGSTAATEVASFSKFFKTTGQAPFTTNVGAVQVTDTSARLVGTIDPRHSETGYVFEYGTTPALGSATAAQNVGEGTAPVTISQPVSGLTKDTTYYYRLTATNAFGSTPSLQATLHTRAIPIPPANEGTCANEQVRDEQSSTYLPECRAYEMVSPPNKNQGDADKSALEPPVSDIATDGNAAAFCSNSLFGDLPGQNGLTCAPYVARRYSTGWQTTDPFPRYCQSDRDGSSGLRLYPVLNANMTRAFVARPESEACFTQPPLDPSAPTPSINLYAEDLLANPADPNDPAAYTLIAPERFDETNYTNPKNYYAGGSDDFSHIIYKSKTNQTSPPDSPAPSDIKKLYDWEEGGHGSCSQPGGCLTLVTKDPSNVPFTTSSAIAAPDPWRGGALLDATPVSDDGNRIYFQNPTTSVDFGCTGGSCDLYMRANQTTTYKVSESECTIDCGSEVAEDRFLWANAAGDVAVFRSCAKLTDSSSANGGLDCSKLYWWNENGAPGHRLVDLTVDEEAADGTQAAAVDILGGAEDGNTVYFVTQHQIVPGAPIDPPLSASGGYDKLYRWLWNDGAPTIAFLGPYLPFNPLASVPVSRAEDRNLKRSHVLVTPDGRFLTFTTPAALDPVADQDMDADVYRWGEEDGWLCVSCQLPGQPSLGRANSEDRGWLNFGFDEGHFESEWSISADGQTIFFSTPDPLVPEDVNGEDGCPVERQRFGITYSCQDIYEWHDGRVTLVSPGTGIYGAEMVGANPSASSVFFLTRDPLLSRDTDSNNDMYVARVGGGFEEPPSEPAGCEGEACRGATTSTPDAVGAGTAAFQGPGTPPGAGNQMRKCRSGQVRRKGRCVKAKQRKKQKAKSRRGRTDR